MAHTVHPGAESTAAPDRAVQSRADGPDVRSRRPAPERRLRPGADRAWHQAFASLCGRVIVVAAFWSVVSSVFRQIRWIRRVDDLFGLVNVPAAPGAFSVVLLFIIGGAVRRRMRVSLWLLLTFQAIAALYLLAVLFVAAAFPDNDLELSGFDLAELLVNAGLTVVLVVALWLSRDAFSSRLEPGARWRALAVLVSGLAISLTFSLGMTMVFPNALRDTAHRIQWAVRSSFGQEPDRTEPGWSSQYGHHWIAVPANIISALALLGAAVVFFRSARAKAFLTAADELQIRRLLLESGERDSLGYFATRHDKSAVFTASHSAAVTYRVIANVSLASADPIGPVAAWPAAIEAWLAESRSFGWFPAVLSASEAGAQAYVEAGLRALPIGDEAIIEVDTFTLEGPTMQPVRRAVHRVQRAGYTISVLRHADLGPDLLQEMSRRAEDWRGGDTERGFSMALGRLGDPADTECVAVLARDADGRLRGMLSMVPWGQRGLSLELMRRDRSSENGLIEAMVAQLIEVCRDELGIRWISLNFAMFRGVFSAAERVGASWFVRLKSRVLTFASRFWQIESLYRSNARYLPRWTTRYLCYDTGLTLARVALAAGMAEGFLPTLSRPRERAADSRVEYEGESLPFTEAVQRQRRSARGALLPSRRLSQQQRVRHDKLELLRGWGMDPYPVSVPRSCDIASIRTGFADLTPGSATGHRVSVVGRVRAVRDFGGLLFAVLQEGTAAVQVIFAPQSVGSKEHSQLRRVIDLGDHVSVTGEVITSLKGELSVRADSWQMAAKCLRPLPDAHAGFADADARLRQRHLDLMVNPDSVEMLVNRSTGVGQLRQSLVERGYLEVETPMLQSVHGGANARPFITHINAYDATLYLRIAPELYLKRLCVAGMGRIFELNRNFRNEGADSTHNPEFTSVEAYQAHADYLDMRELTRELIIEVATAMYGRPVARRRDGSGRLREIDLSKSWPSVTVHDAVSKACGVPVTVDTPAAVLVALCAEHGVRAPRDDPSAGVLITELFEALVEKQTDVPTFYLNFPIETSPLTRAHRSEPRLAERWDLVAWGAEVATAYSELIDPVEQRRRLTEQSLRAAAGDVEAMQVDEDFLSALEYAMPPTGGMGMGVDRLIMMLSGAPIRQTLAFPFVRPGGR